MYVVIRPINKGFLITFGIISQPLRNTHKLETENIMNRPVFTKDQTMFSPNNKSSLNTISEIFK